MSKVLSPDFKRPTASRAVSADVATRNEAGYRFDILDPDFIASLAYNEFEGDVCLESETVVTLCQNALRCLVDYKLGDRNGLVRTASYCMFAYARGHMDNEKFKSYVDCVHGYASLDPDFLREMAEIAHHGSTKYGDWNFTKPGLIGALSPYNHAFAHLTDYLRGVPNDRGDPMLSHFSHAAFNCMMEYWHITRGGRKAPDGTHGPEIGIVTDIAPSAKQAVRPKAK